MTTETTETMSRPLSRVPIWVLALVVPVIAAIAVLATNPSWSAPVATGAVSGSTVRIADFAFSPKALRVAPGTRVTVVNADSTTHTMSATGGAFDTSNLGPGKRTVVVAPKSPGRYPFICQIHPNMKATLVVVAP